MFKRFLCHFVVCLLGLLLSLSGCGTGSDVINHSQSPSNTTSPSQSSSFDPYHDPDLLPVMIMIENIIYQQSDAGTLDASIKIDDSQILGRISKVIGNKRPSHNGESNFLDDGTPYARCPLEEYPDAVVVFYAHEWHIFCPVDA